MVVVSMVRRAHLGYTLIIVGVCICLLSFTLGGGTDRTCPEIDSIVYETTGVQPTEVAITGIDLGDVTVEWYDGCNWRTNSLVPVVFGGLISFAGVLTVRSADPTDSETDG